MKQTKQILFINSNPVFNGPMCYDNHCKIRGCKGAAGNAWSAWQNNFSNLLENWTSRDIIHKSLAILHYQTLKSYNNRNLLYFWYLLYCIVFPHFCISASNYFYLLPFSRNLYCSYYLLDTLSAGILISMTDQVLI